MAKVRAKEVPGLVFEQVREIAEDSPIYEFAIPKKEKWSLVFIRNTETLVGCRKERFPEGERAFLSVWNFFFGKEVTSEHVYRTVASKPILQLVAGPFPDGKFVVDRGRRFKEEVRVELGISFFCNGFPASHASFPVLVLVLNLLAGFVCSGKMADIAYWEAYRNPGGTYTPP